MTQQRPPHRNPGRTAPTHVKSSAGLWRVHDGNKAGPNGTSETVVDPATGKVMDGLTYDEARRMKDYAVTKLRLRKAGVVQQADDAPLASAVPVTAVHVPTDYGARLAASPAIVGPFHSSVFAGEGNPSGDSLDLDLPPVPDLVPSTPAKPMILKATDAPNPDPYLESLRQASLAAAAPAAREAQKRADTLKRQKELLAAAGLPPKPQRDPNHPKSPIVGLDPINELPPEDNDVDGGEDVEQVLATGSKPQKDDAERAREQAEKDAAHAETLGKALFEHEKKPNGTLTWEGLPETQRAGYRWRALNETDIRVGDIVAYTHAEKYEDGHPLAGRYKGELAQVVRVISRDLVNLQLGVKLENTESGRARGTADGRMVLNARRRPAGPELPETWTVVE